MPVLQKRDREVVLQRFRTELKRDVKIKLYTQIDMGLYIPGRGCRYCGPTQELLEELSALSPKIRLEVVDFYKNQEQAADLGIERIPALTVGNGGNGNARFFGMPSGFEFTALLDTIVGASDKRSSLKLETRRQLKALTDDVHIQVFVTPGCQYSPGLARLTHAMAMESPRVTADVIEVQEFPDLIAAYSVMGVPKTVINDRVQFTGAVPEDKLMDRVLQAVGAVEVDGDESADISDQTTPMV